MVAGAVLVNRTEAHSYRGNSTVQNNSVIEAPSVKPGKTARRRQIDPTTCERDYSGEELEFMRALDDYKRRSGRMFPTCSEILEVIRGLGYVRAS